MKHIRHTRLTIGSALCSRKDLIINKISRDLRSWVLYRFAYRRSQMSRHVNDLPQPPLAPAIPPHAATLTRNTRAIVSPIALGFGAIVIPAAARISTFSCALSPNALMIAPAWPILRPFGADSPAI